MTRSISSSSSATLRDALMRCAREKRLKHVLGALRPAERKLVDRHWRTWGRDEQLPPDGDWTIWMFIAATARRRARLENDGAFAQGHGFHPGQARRGARDRAGFRRAANAARHSGRQYIFKLSGSEPRAVAADGSGAALACARRSGALAIAGLRLRAAAAGTGSRPDRGSSL